jgi:hypothetical protein
VRWGAVRWGAVRWGTGRWGTGRWGTVPMVSSRQRRRRLRTARRRMARLVRIVVGAVVVALVVVLCVALADQVSRQSRPYDRSVDAGFAALVGPLGSRSAATGTQLAATLVGAATDTRQDVLVALAREAQAAAEEASAAASATPPDPPSAAGARLCQQALADRSTAAAEAESAVVRLLGGATGTGPGAGDVGEATTTLAAAAHLVSDGDHAWATCRSDLRRAPGHAVVPASIWLPDDGVWSSAAPAALASGIAVSPTLAAAPSLAIATFDTDPPALAQVGSGAVTVPAATDLTVSVVVADTGNVALDGVSVEVSAQPSGGGRGSRRTVTVDRVAAGSSVTAQVGGLAVRPGTTSTVVVDATTAGTPAVAAPSESVVVNVEPAASSASVTASANPVSVGQSVTYTATVTSALAGGVAPSGTVDFADAGGPIAACQGRPLRGGTATCTVRYTSAGLHSITVTYGGSTGIGGSTSPAITETVRAAPAHPAHR